MAFELHEMGIAASVYLSLYVIYTLIAVYSVYSQGIKSLYFALFFYGLIRLGGQISGVGFAMTGIQTYQWLIAYIVLTAEGYFIIILASMYLLCREQRKIWGYSPIETPFKSQGWLKRLSYRSSTHYTLIAANCFIVIGGTLVAGMDAEELQSSSTDVITSKALRIAGQAIFLILTILIFGFAIQNYLYKGLKSFSMKALLFVSPFILVRGIFGVMAALIDQMNYMAFYNYLEAEKHAKLTIYEYVLSTTMEFICAISLLNLIWFEGRGKVEIDEANEECIPLGDSKRFSK